MKKASLLLFLLLFLPIVAYSKADVKSPSGATVLGDFVAEPQMQADLLQMLARFTTYMKADFQPCVAPNSAGEECGCFRGENTMGNDERGVRPNADLSMICAFLVKYGKSAVLPDGVTWDDLESMAMKSLVFAYSTHKANRLKVCAGNNYWGSTSTDDAVWESSLWAMSVAYSAFFQWEKLSEQQRGYIYNLLKAECNYELNRSIPTGYKGDTKAEENGWEADVLAVTLGLFPDDELAPQWFQRLREFAINSYSHPDDANNTTIIDPDYDQTTVKDLYRGQNLYDDYTLQNHNYFHTSYQNVVIQELGEAALALKLFQKELHGKERWQTNALMHNCQAVMDNVLYDLALADGELAMPNGNDWSLFLYDQITSYSTSACFLRDPHALLLENRAYQQIKARQMTTTDGSWLLRPDVGARRMGVQAHRVMMTWLMHYMLPTSHLSTLTSPLGPTGRLPKQDLSTLTPTSWPDFLHQYSRAKVYPSQNIVCASNSQRFTCFSWSQGLKSYTGYIAPQLSTLNPQLSNLIVPFRANNTGNFLGWYEVEGKHTNATPVVNGQWSMANGQWSMVNGQWSMVNGQWSMVNGQRLMVNGNAWLMNGELLTNDGALNHRFAIYSTPGTPVIYLDYVRANTDCTITAEKGGLMAISTDEFTKTSRTFYSPAFSTVGGDLQSPAHRQLDGTTFTTLPGPWVNIDNTFSIINCKESSLSNSTQFSFGERTNNNSIMTSLLFGSYSDKRRTVAKGDVVDCRALTYYSNITAEQTAHVLENLQSLPVPEGWNGIIVPDPVIPHPQLSARPNGTLAQARTLNSPLGPTGRLPKQEPSTLNSQLLTLNSYYLLLSNFAGSSDCTLTGISTPLGSPVFTVNTTITEEGSTATFTAEENHSVANTLKFFIRGNGIEVVQADDAPHTIYLKNLSKGKNTITITAIDSGKVISKRITLKNKMLKATIQEARLEIASLVQEK